MSGLGHTINPYILKLVLLARLTVAPLEAISNLIYIFIFVRTSGAKGVFREKGSTVVERRSKW